MREIINIKVTDCSRTDLTEYSEDELSLWVFNDEALYRMRHNEKRLIEMINSLFIYNDEQLETLLKDLEDEENKS